MKIEKSSINKNYILFILFFAALIERTVFDLGPNVELITAALILGVSYLGTKRSLWLIFAILVISDLFIGNTNIFLFTWSGFLIPVLFVSGVHKRIVISFQIFQTKPAKRFLKVATLTFIGLSANLFFFIWTNFGVWLLDSWGMYEKTFTGLMQSYINALPFLRSQMTSTLIFVPGLLTIFELVSSAIERFKFSSILQLINTHKVQTNS